jgi:hypothetical protein
MSFFSRFFAYFSPQPNAAKAWVVAGDSAQHAYWLFATPVHMQLGRESYFLTTPAPVLVSGDDALALMTSLNQHFNQVGLHFYLQNDIWFLGLDVDPKITTTPIEKVINKDVAPYLIKGENALAWANLQNEIQMLLFSHPVNEVRESQGQPAINSLWFYGLAKA